MLQSIAQYVSLFSAIVLMIYYSHSSPIMQRLYGSAGAAPSGFPGAGGEEGPSGGPKDLLLLSCWVSLKLLAAFS